jgi:Kelch motif
MWSPVVHLDTTAGAVPPTRSKHAVSLNPETNHVYVLGGRNGNVPLKDFWIFSIGKCSHPRQMFSREVDGLR